MDSIVCAIQRKTTTMSEIADDLNHDPEQNSIAFTIWSHDPQNMTDCYTLVSMVERVSGTLATMSTRECYNISATKSKKSERARHVIRERSVVFVESEPWVSRQYTTKG